MPVHPGRILTDAVVSERGRCRRSSVPRPAPSEKFRPAQLQWACWSQRTPRPGKLAPAPEACDEEAGEKAVPRAVTRTLSPCRDLCPSSQSQMPSTDTRSVDTELPSGTPRSVMWKAHVNQEPGPAHGTQRAEAAGPHEEASLPSGSGSRGRRQAEPSSHCSR